MWSLCSPRNLPTTGFFESGDGGYYFDFERLDRIGIDRSIAGPD